MLGYFSIDQLLLRQVESDGFQVCEKSSYLLTVQAKWPLTPGNTFGVLNASKNYETLLRTNFDTWNVFLFERADKFGAEVNFVSLITELKQEVFLNFIINILLP